MRTITPKSTWLRSCFDVALKQHFGLTTGDLVVVHQITDCLSYIQLEVEVRHHTNQITFHRVIFK